MPCFCKIRPTDARLMPCCRARLRAVQRRLGSLSSINILRRGRYKQSETTACSTASGIRSRGGTLSTSQRPRIPWERKRPLQWRTFARVMERSWAMRLLGTPLAARRTMPARLRTRSGISAEAATASRMTCSADDRGRSGAGCHTGLTPLYGLLGPADSGGGVINGPWCSYLHYREDHAKMVSGRKIRGLAVAPPLSALCRAYKTSKSASLYHFAETLG